MQYLPPRPTDAQMAEMYTKALNKSTDMFFISEAEWKTEWLVKHGYSSGFQGPNRDDLLKIAQLKKTVYLQYPRLGEWFASWNKEGQYSEDEMLLMWSQNAGGAMSTAYLKWNNQKDTWKSKNKKRLTEEREEAEYQYVVNEFYTTYDFIGTYEKSNGSYVFPTFEAWIQAGKPNAEKLIGGLNKPERTGHKTEVKQPSSGGAGATTTAPEPSGSESEDDMDLPEDIQGTIHVKVNKEQLHHALRECDRSYYPEKIPPEEQKLYTTFEKNGSKATIRQHQRIEQGSEIGGIEEGTWEVTFRGTHVTGDWYTAVMNILNDTVTHVISLDHACFTHEGAPHNALTAEAYNLEEQGVVALGFAKHLDEIYRDVVAHLQPAFEAGDKIIVNGHSLGSVSAQLFALCLFLTRDIKVHRVYAFASPRGFDTMTPYLSWNLDIIHVLDQRDPVPIMYPIFYESHAGFKIIQTDREEIKYLNNDEMVYYLTYDKETSRQYYKQKQFDAKDEYFKKHWSSDVNILSEPLHRAGSSFMSFLRANTSRFLHKEGVKQALERLTTFGASYHNIGNYRKLIDKISDSGVTFVRSFDDYKGLVDREEEEEEKEGEKLEKLLVVDFWQWKTEDKILQPNTTTPQPQTQIEPSQILADYITPEMLVNGFILYGDDPNAKLENNFITY